MKIKIKIKIKIKKATTTSLPLTISADYPEKHRPRRSQFISSKRWELKKQKKLQFQSNKSMQETIFEPKGDWYAKTATIITRHHHWRRDSHHRERKKYEGIVQNFPYTVSKIQRDW